MKMAQLTSELSSAVRLKVGTVIVRDHQILATGYNGTPTGWDNTCEDRQYMPERHGGWYDEGDILQEWPYIEFHGEFNDQKRYYRLKTKPHVLHSEANAVLKIARSTESSVGATLFCTHAPCLDCAKLIYQSGISSVYYRSAYRETTGIDFLTQSGVTVERYAD